MVQQRIKERYPRKEHYILCLFLKTETSNHYQLIDVSVDQHHQFINNNLTPVTELMKVSKIYESPRHLKISQSLINPHSQKSTNH